MKMQHVAPIGRSTFGKNGNVFTCSKNVGDFLIDHTCMSTTASPQKNGLVARSQPAGQWPAPHILLGHEGRWKYGVDHEYVDPRNMVGKQQGTGNGVPQIGLDFKSERFKQRSRPTGLERQPALRSAHWVEEQGNQYTTENQQRQPENAVTACSQVCFVQSACPR